jgi:hypothetical protein
MPDEALSIFRAITPEPAPAQTAPYTPVPCAPPDPYAPNPPTQPLPGYPYSPPDSGDGPDPNDDEKKRNKAVILGIFALIVVAGVLIGGLLLSTNNAAHTAVSNAYGQHPSQAETEPDNRVSLPPLNGREDPATPSDEASTSSPSPSGTTSPSATPSDTPTQSVTPDQDSNGSAGQPPATTPAPSRSSVTSTKLCRQSQGGPDNSVAYAKPQHPGTTLFYIRNVNHGDEVQDRAFPHWLRNLQSGSVARTGGIKLQNSDGNWRPDTDVLPQYGANDQAAYDDLVNQAVSLWTELPQAGACS